MIKANNIHEEKVNATFLVNDASLERVKEFVQFPIDMEERKHQKRLIQMQRYLSGEEENIVYHRRSLSENKRNAANWRKEIAALEARHQEQGIKITTIEDARTQVETIGKLAWVEHVELDGTTLFVRTRKGMLKTIFDTRWVYMQSGLGIPEFLEGPVTVDLPTYEIRLNISQIGTDNSIANNAHYLAIRLIDTHDTSAWVAMPQQTHSPQAHWAALGNSGIGNWAKICFGEYEEDIVDASHKGLLPLFTEFAVFLQNCGDEHAYYRKPYWAQSLGKPEYNEYCSRLMRPEETESGLNEKYRKDFRILRQPETSGTNPDTAQQAFADRQAVRAIRHRRAGSIFSEDPIIPIVPPDFSVGIDMGIDPF